MEYTELHIKAMLTVAHNEIDDLDDEDPDDMEVLKTINTEDINDTDIYEYALGIDIRKYHRIHLSIGGPASFIEVITDDQDEIIDVYYHFQDWFDGAKRKVDEDSSIYRYAMMILETNTNKYN
jgi:hypothetical protein